MAHTSASMGVFSSFSPTKISDLTETPAHLHIGMLSAPPDLSNPMEPPDLPIPLDPLTRSWILVFGHLNFSLHSQSICSRFSSALSRRASSYCSPVKYFCCYMSKFHSRTHRGLMMILDPCSSLMGLSLIYSLRCMNFVLTPCISGIETCYQISLFEISLAIVRTPTAICRLLCFLIPCAIKFFSLSLWQVIRDEIVNVMFSVNLDYLGIYYIDFSGNEYVPFPMFPFLLSGFIAGRYESKITAASASILFEGSLQSRTLDHHVFFVSGIVSPLSNIIVDLLHGFSCLSTWTASIPFFYALCFAFVVVLLMALMALVSYLVSNFFFDGEYYDL